MATIVIQNVFDPSQNYLINCEEKDHLLDGQVFCDELIVLPPGVYEVIVQSSDPNCRAERDWYKVIVEPNETVELEVNLICGGANGGLDVIVTENNTPLITDIDFIFYPGGGTANKYMCREGDQVNIRVTVEDDAACSTLFANYAWYLDGVLVPATPPFPAPIVAVGTAEPTPGECVFGLLVDPSLATQDDYDLTLEVSDGELTGQITFPIHFIDCPADGGTP